MTDYASSVAAAEPSWTWWMTTAAAAAMRMRDLRRERGGDDGDGGGYSDADDEFAGPDRKRQRFANEEYWMAVAAHDRNDDGSRAQDPASVGPLDLSVKATVTTATAVHVIDGRAAANGAGQRDEHATKTPVKRSTGAANGRSSKKSTGKTARGGGASAAAVKAATRKLLPQLQLDHRVDRSSPVSGTIIVPVTPEQDQSTGGQLTSPPRSPYTVASDCANDGRQDDDYDGGDIDPEFNVVVATDEARRRLENIPNALGPYRCRLCNVRYVDAFALARHRCRCIVHVRYRCPECDKVFQCPANLASHRRWHGTGAKSSGGSNNNNNNNNNNSRNKGTTTEIGGNKLEHEMTTNHDNAEANGDVTVGGGETTSTIPASSRTAITMNVAGFKKNILQRAVQAAAAAAHENTGVAKNVP